MLYNTPIFADNHCLRTPVTADGPAQHRLSYASPKLDCHILPSPGESAEYNSRPSVCPAVSGVCHVDNTALYIGPPPNPWATSICLPRQIQKTRRRAEVGMHSMISPQSDPATQSQGSRKSSQAAE